MKRILAAVLLLVGGLPVRAAFSADSCLAAVGQPIRAGGTNGVESLYAADLDDDGDIDVVTASFGDDRISWFENTGGSPPSFVQHTISTSADGAISVFVANVDGDLRQNGHDVLDVLVASSNDDKIRWYRNDGGSPPSFTEHVVTTGADLALAVYAKDVDADGDVDVLSASFQDNTIAWYENDGAAVPSFTEHVISNTSLGAAAVFADDLDGDGDVDVLAASRLDDTVAWYEQTPGAAMTDPPQFTRHVISASAVRATSVFAAKLTAGDTRLDVLVASSGDDKIRWFENLGGSPPSFAAHLISSTALGVKSVFAAKLDAGDDIDVLAASAFDDTIAWYESSGGASPTFTRHVISSNAVSADAVFAADVDDDGSLDVLSVSSVPGFRATDDRVAWYENLGGAPPSFTERTISTNSTAPESLATAKVNGDMNIDILVASSVDDKIAWYENDGAAVPSFTEHVIATDADGAVSVFAAKLDSDGDTDVLSASALDSKIAWYENDGAAVPSFTEHVITTDADGAASVFAADLDGDLDIDVLSASELDDKIAWYENLGGSPPSFAAHVISLHADGAAAVFAAKVDPDSHTDVLSASRLDNRIVLWQNDGATPPGFTEVEISHSAVGARSVYAAELDNDTTNGREILSASSGDNKIAWYRLETAVPPAGDLLFGNVFVGASKVLVLTLQNPAPTALHVTGSITVGSPGFSSDPVDLMIDPASSAPVSITFTPSSVASFSGTLSLTTDDPNQPLLSFALSGAGKQYVEHVITTGAFFARWVTAVDVDGSGRRDVLTASSNDDTIAIYVHASGEKAATTFSKRTVSTDASAARAVVADYLNNDGTIDLMTAFYFEIDWHQGGIKESCAKFDAVFPPLPPGDPEVGRIDGTELGWYHVALPTMNLDCTVPGVHWECEVDFNGDGMIDGEDLAILTTPGVWGKFAGGDHPGQLCHFTCISQE